MELYKGCNRYSQHTKTAYTQQKTWQNSIQFNFTVIEYIHIFLKIYYTKKFNKAHLMNMYVVKNNSTEWNASQV